MDDGKIETGTGTYTVSSDGAFSLQSGWACVLNSVAAGQAKGLQCWIYGLDGNGNYVIAGTALKQ